MSYSPGFLKLRAVVFLCITVISIVWVVLLCFELFWRWDISDKSERTLILVLILINAITVVLLPILMILQFRPWLDAARFMFLLTAHIGTAIVFTVWNPKFQCFHHSADQEGICRMINMFILIGTWVNPVLLLSYASGLVIMVCHRSRQTIIMAKYEPSYQKDAEVTTGLTPFPPARTPESSLFTPISVDFPAPSNMVEFNPQNQVRWDTQIKSSIGEGNPSRMSTSAMAWSPKAW